MSEQVKHQRLTFDDERTLLNSSTALSEFEHVGLGLQPVYFEQPVSSKYLNYLLILLSQVADELVFGK